MAVATDVGLEGVCEAPTELDWTGESLERRHHRVTAYLAPALAGTGTAALNVHDDEGNPAHVREADGLLLQRVSGTRDNRHRSFSGMGNAGHRHGFRHPARSAAIRARNSAATVAASSAVTCPGPS